MSGIPSSSAIHSSISSAEAYRSLSPAIDAVLQGAEPTFESEIDYPDGVTRFVRIAYAPDRDSDGAPRDVFADRSAGK